MTLKRIKDCGSFVFSIHYSCFLGRPFRRENSICRPQHKYFIYTCSNRDYWRVSSVFGKGFSKFMFQRPQTKSFSFLSLPFWVWCLRGRNFDFDFFRAITLVTWLIEKVEGSFSVFFLPSPLLALIALDRFSTQSAPAHPFPSWLQCIFNGNGIWQQHPDRR